MKNAILSVLCPFCMHFTIRIQCTLMIQHSYYSYYNVYNTAGRGVNNCFKKKKKNNNNKNTPSLLPQLLRSPPDPDHYEEFIITTCKKGGKQLKRTQSTPHIAAFSGCPVERMVLGIAG